MRKNLQVSKADASARDLEDGHWDENGEDSDEEMEKYLKNMPLPHWLVRFCLPLRTGIQKR